LKKRRQARGLVEDRRVPPPKAFLALLQKLVLNEPWLAEDTRDPVVPPAAVFQRGGRMSPAEWAALSELYQQRVARMRPRPLPQRRSGR
jgi:hypothetical protein